MIAVTTFPKWGWDVYAEHCLNSWIKAWPGMILAYFEGDAPPPRVPGVVFRPLDEIAARADFLKRDLPEPTSYLDDAKRFCHKVFAQLDAMEEHQQFCWIDADVEMRERVPEELVDAIVRKSFVSFLGRDTYTETGFIGFNQKYPGFDAFKKRYEKGYGDDPLVLHMRYQIDCLVFDWARQGGGYNLTPDGKGVENVMKRSALGKYMYHHKGNRKLKIEEHA